MYGFVTSTFIGTLLASIGIRYELPRFSSWPSCKPAARSSHTGRTCR